MTKKLFPVFLLYITCTAAINTTQLLFEPPLTVIGHATKTAHFVHDARKRAFVLKYHYRGPKHAIHDALGAYVGKSIGININEVEIFPYYHPLKEFFDETYPLKSTQIGLTTLHTRVPGTTVKNIKHMNGNIYIKHGLRNQKNVDSLIQHPYLCTIVALDIFTDNTDRTNKNFLFDQTTEQFYAIDMDHAFNNAHALHGTATEYDFPTVATFAYDFLEELDPKKLSREEIIALKQVKKTLEKLIIHNSPAQLYDAWMNIAQKAGYQYNLREQEKIKKYLAHNAHEVELLQSLLDALISTNKFSQTTNSQKI